MIRRPIDPDDHQRLIGIPDRSPALAGLAGYVRSFPAVMSSFHGQHLETWMTTVEADNLSALRSWSSGCGVTGTPSPSD